MRTHQSLLRRPLALALILPLLAPALVRAEGVLKVQHGGRATAQVGAFTGRASDPSAVTYNPAGIVQLDGWQLQAGLDFSNATDDYASSTSRHRAKHSIQFPPALYLTWRPDAKGNLAYGLGLDTSAWYRVDWETALFPGRFLDRTQEVRSYELHPVVAYRLDDHWSVGGGLRYLFGSLERGQNYANEVGLNDGQGGSALVAFELQNRVNGDADALSFDLGTQYQSDIWGFGALYRHSAELKGNGNWDVVLRDISAPAFSRDLLSRFTTGRDHLQFELPAEVRAGAWLAPYPELRLELDVALTRWSSVGGTSELAVVPTPGLTFQADLRTRERAALFDDTLSLRLGVEGDLSDTWSLAGGIAFEPSPASGQATPDFPRGDETVYAVGASYNLPQISFDLAYSYSSFADRKASGQGIEPAGVVSTYSSRDQVWSFSARWRF